MLPALSEIIIYNPCQNALPYCVATGYHITPTDLTVCPLCKFPAVKSEFLALVEDGVVCPMCVETVAASDVRTVTPGQLRAGHEELEEPMEEENEEEEAARPFTGSSRASSGYKL